MNVQKVIEFWLKSAEDDFDTAEKLFAVKKYHHCLFFCHLFLEKAFKALVVKKTGQHALPIHNLVRLASCAKLKLSQKRKKELKAITGFNLEARYNSHKREFYKKATKEFAEKWFKICKEIYAWVKKML